MVQGIHIYRQIFQTLLCSKLAYFKVSFDILVFPMSNKLELSSYCKGLLFYTPCTLRYVRRRKMLFLMVKKCKQYYPDRQGGKSKTKDIEI